MPEDFDDPTEKKGSEIATAPAAHLGTAEESSAATSPAPDGLAAKIDALHTKHFADTDLGHHTPLWNAMLAFKEDVKALVAGHS